MERYKYFHGIVHVQLTCTSGLEQKLESLKVSPESTRKFSVLIYAPRKHVQLTDKSIGREVFVRKENSPSFLHHHIPH